MGNIIIYCDGACSGNQFKENKGGWAALILHNDIKKMMSGSEVNTTNQRMELLSCIYPLVSLEKETVKLITVYSDSAYLINTMNENWYERWEKNGWRNSAGKPVQNKDLWQKLLALTSQYNITFVKVAGHSSDLRNAEVNKQAQIEAGSAW